MWRPRETAAPLAAVLVASALALTACGGSDGSSGQAHKTPSASTGGSSPSASASTTATVDPAGRIVPMNGDSDIPIRWTLDRGVDPSDPVVEVARRTLALVQLGYLSDHWSSRAVLRKAVRALTTGGTVVSAATYASWTRRDKSAPDARERVLVLAPDRTGDHPVVWTCLWYDDRRTAAMRDSTAVRIDVVADQGAWRVSDYNQNASPPTAVHDRCDSFPRH